MPPTGTRNLAVELSRCTGVTSGGASLHKVHVHAHLRLRCLIPEVSVRCLTLGIQCRHLQTFLLLPTFLLLLWQSITTLRFSPPASSSGVPATHSRTHSQRAGPGISRLARCRGRVQQVAAPCPAPGCSPSLLKLIPAALASTQLSCSCCWPSSTPPDSLSSVLSSGADGEHGTTQAKKPANSCLACLDLTLMVARRLFSAAA